MKVRWLGHAGFKLSFADPSDSSVTRNIFIDTWINGPTFPESAKDEMNDADLILVTHGHFDHSSGAPILYNNSIENGKSPKIVSIYEIVSILKDSKSFIEHIFQNPSRYPRRRSSWNEQRMSCQL